MKNSTLEYDLSSTTWRKSTYSGEDDDDCLEVADGHPTLVPVPADAE